MHVRPSPNKLPRISLKLQDFCYPNGTVALREVEVNIFPGEAVAILGANGSGKTTLLKVMDGLLPEYNGSVLLDGEEIRRLSPKEIYSKMGLIFQNPEEQLFANTVFEDVAFGPLNMGFGEEEIRERVKAALKDVGMEGSEQKRIQHLSYGQKKRVCIAGLLAMGHQILLMDEPTSGLDPQGELEMVRLLQRLNREKGVTLVIASHNVDLVPVFMDRVYVLYQGLVVKEGAPWEVFLEPKELAHLGLRLPYVGELMWWLKHRCHFPLNDLPLTVVQDLDELVRLYQNK